MVGREGEDHCRHGRRLTLAHEVKIQHALDGHRHEAVDGAPSFGGEILYLVVGLVIGDLTMEGGQLLGGHARSSIGRRR